MFKNETLEIAKQCYVCEEYRFIEEFWKRGKNTGPDRESRCKYCILSNTTKTATDKIDWKRRTYSKEEFILAWNSSLSVSECARALNIAVNSPTTRKTARMLGLDSSHMRQLGQQHNKRSCQELFVYGKIENGTRLKKALTEELGWKKKCSDCGISQWLGNEAPLELDHISGDRLDNTLSNLRLLCPNCHSFTETYRGKNIGKQNK